MSDFKPHIEIYKRENDKLAATISIKDGKLEVTDFFRDAEADLKSYLSQHKGEWEQATFTIHTGGKREDGILWHGKNEVSINDENYLVGLKDELDKVKKDVFNMKYIFFLSGL